MLWWALTKGYGSCTLRKHSRSIVRITAERSIPDFWLAPIYIYIFFFESVLIAVTVNKKDLYFGRTLFWAFSFVHKIVLFGAFPRAKNRALDRAFWCSPSCTKSCFLVLSLVHKIVLFGALPRAKNRALDRAFWCSPSCHKSCFVVLSFVPKIVL